ncbi:MAG: hypothetical protein HQL09_07695 [Nitrospirae bacterium]|nr:hypothetical protein [Nitrospirota bacterium]
MDLEQFIDTLSEEERQRHKDLIEECRLRSERTRKSCSRCFRNLRDLSIKLESAGQILRRNGQEAVNVTLLDQP